MLEEVEPYGEISHKFTKYGDELWKLLNPDSNFIQLRSETSAYEFQNVACYNLIIHSLNCSRKACYLNPRDQLPPEVLNTLDYSYDISFMELEYTLIDEEMLKKAEADKNGTNYEQKISSIPEFKKVEKEITSIYDYVPKRKQSTSSSNQEHLNKVIIEKDNELKDLKLNITMLEQYMKSLSAENKKTIEEWKSKNEEIKQKLNDKMKIVESLKIENDELNREIHSLEDENIEKNMFTDITSQKEYNEKMKMVEKLLNMKQKYEILNDIDLSYMKPIERPKLFKSLSPIHVVSDSLRELAGSIHPVKIEDYKNERVQHLINRENFVNYESIKNHQFLHYQL
ncbi:unnamed protein product [Candida verbasci]|uniref:Uncharacterized protein n=1 Tax=Candida verbasci TaxID=1227364 RepID=A0A9W4X8E9_9ASCO|nr:unnamed protein product [Candida verbasci]